MRQQQPGPGKRVSKSYLRRGMLARLIPTIALVGAILAFLVPASALAVDVDPLLQQQLLQAAGSDRLVAVVTFTGMPSDDTLATVSRQSAFAYRFERLPMIVVAGSPSQIRALAGLPGVLSVYSNKQLDTFMHEAAPLAGGGVAREFFGITGAGVGVAIVDSGIDGTHPDVSYPQRTIQNVKVLLGDMANAEAGLPSTQIVVAENLPDTDTSSGHGTHVAGIAGGDGSARPGYWVGMAPKSNLIGVSTGEAIVIVNALEGFDYVLTHQQQYNIRVVNNSWGSTGDFVPTDPVNVASKILHDNGITVVFAAGNEGPGENTMNPYAVAPWVIGVGAVAKDGMSLAGFSSVGVPGDPLKHPTLVAPGTLIVSAKSTVPVVSLASLSSQPSLTSGYFTSYTALSGTSMAAPFVTGAVADMLQANQALPPDDIKQILIDSAEPLPAYGLHQAGAGFLRLDRALSLAMGTSLPVDSALQVISMTPAGGSTNVPVGSKIVLKFSQPLAAASVNSGNVYLMDGSGGSASATVTYDAVAGTATIVPAQELHHGEKYRVVVTTGIKNTAGSYALRSFTAPFTTGACTVSVTPIGCLPV